MEKELRRTTISVGNMTCAACSRAVERAVKKLDGVTEAYVNISNHKARITYDPDVVSMADIDAAIEKAGYISLGEQQQVDEEKEAREARNRFVFSAIFTIPLFYLTMGGMVGLPIPGFLDGPENAKVFAVVQLLLTLPTLWAGRQFYTGGFRALFHGAPNMDTLVAVGTSAAFLYSIYTMVLIFMGDGHAVHNLYFESVVVIITLILMGRFLEKRAQGKTRAAIKALYDLTPDTAIVIRKGVEMEIPVKEMKMRDIFVVKPGARVPVDGVAESGNTYIDESMLTGESMPVEKSEGDLVYAGTVNGTGSVTCKATALGGETVLSRIIDMVEDAMGKRPPIAQMADTISGVFVPVIMGLALVVFLFWMFVMPEGFVFAMTAAITVLVIACPCALGLATPTAVTVGIGRGASLGILIQGGDSLQTAGDLTAVVMDKTGTITQGKPKVTDVLGQNPDEILSIAAALERNSEHPIATAIVEGAAERGLEPGEAVDFQSITGGGVRATVDGTDYHIGSLSLGQELGADTDGVEDDFARLAAEGKTPVCLYKGRETIGLIAVADMVRPESKDAIARLQRDGIETYMLSGDNQKTAEAIAKEVGIQRVFAGVLPDGKAEVIAGLQAEGKKVAMVGDGINDAPALAVADVGIAMGTGTDVAMETADIVLMHRGIQGVVTAIELSRATMRNIKQNLFWAFFYNILMVPVAAGVLHLFGGPMLNPMFAAAAMALSSVTVVTNALRLRFFKG
ncbi:heavy metal translocating P-type ATPase [Eubacteriales bacterium OttesenSCG-928-M02]|nr:heavy metal translocating P-type ATPase [Eubacteriales bacterium OttesenSCG-928-M02]